jgi:hypothetical protein
MKRLAELRKWIGAALRELFPVCDHDDPIGAMQREAVDRNQRASETNRRANDETNRMLAELLLQMEAKRSD